MEIKKFNFILIIFVIFLLFNKVAEADVISGFAESDPWSRVYSVITDGNYNIYGPYKFWNITIVNATYINTTSDINTTGSVTANSFCYNNGTCLSVATDYTFNSTQFETTPEVTIKTNWLESFVNALSKWANYWSKTENITSDKVTANYHMFNDTWGIMINESDDIIIGYIGDLI
jgi:hypothetical protein